MDAEEVREEAIAENRAKVLKALRSGEYIQIRGRYRGNRYGLVIPPTAETDCFCVVGLMREVTRNGAGFYEDGTDMDNVSFSALGIENDEDGENWSAIVRWNDRERAPFPEIADRLESFWSSGASRIPQIHTEEH